MNCSRRLCGARLRLAVLYWSLRLAATLIQAPRLGGRSHRRGLPRRGAGSSHSLERGEDNPAITVSYSPNFQRHVVRFSEGGGTIKSYLWLEDALLNYPDAVPQPLQMVDNGAVGASGSDAMLREVTKQIPGTSPKYGYPSRVTWLNDTDNAAAIRDYLGARLGLPRPEIDAIPGVFGAPAAALRERVEFLLAPLPPALQNATGAAVLAAEDADWPLEFERRGAGAGLSAPQVATALLMLPQKLLPPPPMTREATMSPEEYGALLSYLFQETPSVVLEMARSQLDPHIGGTTNLCIAAFAHLHWKGWEWRNSCVIIQALPSVLTTSLEPSWEVLNRKGKVPSRLRVDATNYLQSRLQLRPWQIHAMIRTHPMLIGYSKDLLQRLVDGLHSRLGITTAELQRIVLRHPSLLGMSLDTLRSRISFWNESVGVSGSQLAMVIMRLPAVLQYSVEGNLKEKLNLFRQTLCLDDESIARITNARPTLWGRSLNRHYKPWIEGFQERLGVGGPDLGRIISRVPELFLCNWRATLLPRLDYLQLRLNLNDAELKALVQSTPQVLTQSIKTSLEPKIRMLEASASEQDHVRLVLSTNPSLALISNKSLQKRLEKINQQTKSKSSDDVSRSTYLVQKLGRVNGGTGRSRKVWLVRCIEGDEEFPPIEFENVAESATFCGMSRSNLYRVIRKGLTVDVGGDRFRVAYADVLGSMNGAKQNNNSTEGLTSTVPTLKESKPTATLSIDTTGRAYPPEVTIRGRRRAGGMALKVHLSGTNTDVVFWRKIVGDIWEGQKYKFLGNADSVLVLLGYSYTRPSRPRCSLYVIREALRLAREWVRQTPGLEHRVYLRTDSLNYVTFLLQEDLLKEWGTCENLASFVKQYKGPTDHVYQANPDILHPLARTYRHLLLKEVPVTIEADSSIDPRLGQGALMAARRMYATI